MRHPHLSRFGFARGMPAHIIKAALSIYIYHTFQGPTNYIQESPYSFKQDDTPQPRVSLLGFFLEKLDKPSCLDGVNGIRNRSTNGLHYHPRPPVLPRLV